MSNFENKTIVDLVPLLIASLQAFIMSCEVTIDEAESKLAKVETYLDGSLIRKHVAKANCNLIALYIVYVSSQFLASNDQQVR